jgi:hypothetical protein
MVVPVVPMGLPARYVGYCRLLCNPGNRFAAMVLATKKAPEGAFFRTSNNRISAC